MATETKNLKLCKKNPETDGNEYFDIKTMLNDNWDKIDQGIEADRDRITKLNNEVIHKLDKAVKIVNYPSVIEHFSSKVASPVDVSMEGKMVVNYANNGNDYGNWSGMLSSGSEGVTVLHDAIHRVSKLPIDIKANKTYTIIANIVSDDTSYGLKGYLKNKEGYSYFNMSSGKQKVFLKKDAIELGLYIHADIVEDGKTIKFNQVMILEGDWTNQDVPYCESAQPLEHPYVKLVRENLLKLTQGSITANGVTITVKENKVVLHGTATASTHVKLTDGFKFAQSIISTWYDSHIQVLKKDTQYNMNLLDVVGNGVVNIVLRKRDTTHYLDYRVSDGAPPQIFNYSNPVAFFQLWFPSGTTFNNYSFKIQLNEGTIPLPYTPYKESLAILPTHLAEIPNTSYRDNLREIKGTKGIVERKVKRVKLDENLDWELIFAVKEYKRIKSANVGINSIWEKNILKKYNGKILTHSSPTDNSDQYMMYSDADRALYLTISNTDTGWGESYTPTEDEIKAFMMGWKMYQKDLDDYDTPYTSGTKAWCYFNDENLNSYSTNGYDFSGNVPIERSPAIIEGFIKYYELFYALENPYEEEVDLDIPFGSEGLATVEGMNTVEVGSGLVWEKAIPEILRANEYVYINNIVLPNHLNYKTKHIKSIYKKKDGNFTIDDDNWTWSIASAYGKSRLYIKKEDLSTKYDSQAEYYVLYEMLDEEYNNQLANAQIKYEENLRESHNKLVEHVGEVEGDIAGINKEIKDTMIKGDGERIEYGIFETPITQGFSSAITFKRAFSNNPTIFITGAGWSQYIDYIGMEKPTTTSFTPYLKVSTEDSLKKVWITWMAIGK
ncbi:MAG: hypothetical protein N4A64_07060 [Marinisporobacter sp.]|nr:hypothetical protein [Marinisporobacter sp.]